MTITNDAPGSDTAVAEYDVVVVGAGFTGIHQLRRLRELGFSVTLLEGGSDLGGVWNLNRYPGARVDSHAPIYQFSDEQIWRDFDFTELFPDHRELRKYFNHVDSKLNLRTDCRFGAKVTAASFDQEANTWTLSTEDGQRVRGRFVVFATGSTVEPYAPPFPGQEDYRGTLVHTARWPEGLDYANKRVAVIGTGASGLQVIQEIGPVAEHLTVFQRTPNLSLPMQQQPLSAADNAKLKETYADIFANWGNTFAGADFDFDPRKASEVSDAEREEVYERIWQAGGFRFWLATFYDTVFDEVSNRHAYDFWKKKIRARITDPKKADLLAPHEPPHPFGTKRPALHQTYYEVMDQSNVSIIPVRENPIERFTAAGIRTADGVEHEFDIIVLATGYDSNTGVLKAIDLRGTAGRTMAEKWANGVDAHLGVMTNEFPNLVFLYGPQSPTGFVNGTASAELQGDVIVDLLDFMRKNGHKRFESTPDADQEWTAVIDAIDKVALFRKADSWYNGGNIPGKPRQMLQYPGGMPAYLQYWEEEKKVDYSVGIVIS